MRKVLSGEKLQIPASTYNAFVDAAQANIAQNNFLTESSKNGESRKVIVQNNSGGNLDKFEKIGKYLIERETLNADDLALIMKGEDLPAVNGEDKVSSSSEDKETEDA